MPLINAICVMKRNKDHNKKSNAFNHPAGPGCNIITKLALRVILLGKDIITVIDNDPRTCVEFLLIQG